MVRVLIPTQTADVHAKAVKHALERKGHEAVLWYGADLPTQQTLSLDIACDGGVEFNLQGVDIDACDDFDVVWLRRPASAMPPHDMHPGDRIVAEREWGQLMRGVWHTLGANAFWINPLSSDGRACSKPLQLSEAAGVGLAIPKTLCSNDPRKIRAFLRESPGEVVYKPFVTAQWRLNDGIAYQFTSVIGEVDLPTDDILRLAPGIFQHRVDKAHELRVTFIGDRPFTAKLLSQELTVSQIDWRAGTRAIGTEVADLPEHVAQRCRALMRRLGIVFGCFDFIVTPRGEYVFLEINPMGQFLWLEEMNPEFRLLDAFCEFLIQRRVDFDWEPTSDGARFGQLRDDSRDQDIDFRHVNYHITHMVDDDLAPHDTGA